jgi:hypothetical protein
VLRDVARLIDAEMVHRAPDMVTVEATTPSAGRGMRGWLREEMLLAGAGGGAAGEAAASVAVVPGDRGGVGRGGDLDAARVR